MTDALDLLTRCYRAGVRVLPHGDRLRLDGRPCPEELKADLRTHRAAVLTALTTHGVGQFSPVRQVSARVGYVVPCPNIVCPVLGPCRWVLAGELCPLVWTRLQDANIAVTARHMAPPEGDRDSGWETAADLLEGDSV
ncbi:MAG: hypothetical protein ACR2OU_11905 [Thermomicrobiales bacterium]